MTEAAANAGIPSKEDPETLVLRGRPRPAVRFRRGVIIGISAAFLVALIGLAWLALQPMSFRKAALVSETEEQPGNGASEALANAPKTYGDVPRLGPPLPGDLGRPILEHERSLGEDRVPGLPLGKEEGIRNSASARLTEAQHIEADRQAARSSALLVQLGSSGSERTSLDVQKAAPQLEASPEAVPATSVPSSGQHKLDFVRSSEGDTNTHGLIEPVSPWTLSAGTIIPASLITGLDSDLPGTIIAQVSENVRDSATGNTVLIPQGARLIGAYDSVVAYGQRRALLVWKRIVLPDGSSIGLDNMPATDAAGYAGLEADVDFHTWRLLKGIGLSTLLGVGTQLSIGASESDLVRALRETVQQNAAHAGDQITARNLEVQPTIKVKPGWPVRAVVNKDLILEPWKGLASLN